jgi:hypothetical protein
MPHGSHVQASKLYIRGGEKQRRGSEIDLVTLSLIKRTLSQFPIYSLISFFFLHLSEFRGSASPSQAFNTRSATFSEPDVKRQQGAMEQQMMMLLEQLLQGQQTMAGLEKSLDGVRKKVGLFNGQNITRFMRIYEDEMSFHGIPDVMKVTSFSRACSSSIHGQIATFQEENTIWMAFKEAMLNAFSLDDLTKVTRCCFEDWVAIRKPLFIMSILADHSCYHVSSCAIRRARRFYCGFN